ncbi:hypothetical protein JW766_05640 [Candidatus Dojkabacteria bacterium]|nr:hypothetical protein [Candidatus Dojkabacteria bacterium]
MNTEQTEIFPGQYIATLREAQRSGREVVLPVGTLVSVSVAYQREGDDRVTMDYAGRVTLDCEVKGKVEELWTSRAYRRARQVNFSVGLEALRESNVLKDVMEAKGLQVDDITELYLTQTF